MSEKGQGLTGLVKMAASYIKTDILLDEPIIPADQMDPQTIAGVILNRIGGPVSECETGNRWTNPFSVADVVGNCGHLPLTTPCVYQRLFPNECQAARKQLDVLVRQGALERRLYEKADCYGETICYKVIEPDLLRELAAKKTNN